MIAREQLMQRRHAAEPHPTAMIERPGPVLRWFFGRFFREIAFPDEARRTIRQAAERGTVVYVCKTLSYIDYLYFTYAFLDARAAAVALRQRRQDAADAAARPHPARRAPAVARAAQLVGGRAVRGGAAAATRRCCS